MLFVNFKHSILAGISRLQEKTTGRVLNLVTAHPMAGAAPRGRPHAHRPRLVAMYREIVTNLARIAPVQAHFGRVYLAGDFNIDYPADARHRVAGFPYRQFTRIGYHSMWAGQRPRTGTIGHAFLDGVWARQRPIRRQILTNFRYSDHKPVIATYWFP
jgi:endonuclease/exonuclease/phosphatase (EEP) superfamily protein YafD